MNRLTRAATSASSRMACALAVLMCCFMVGHFVWHFVGTAANIAFADDIVDALWFFEIFQQAPTLGERLWSLLLPNHEHISLLAHLIYLACYALAGEFNFLHFIVVGNLAMPWLAWLLWRWGREHINGCAALVLAVAFSFQLFSAETNFYSVPSLATKFVFIFAMLAFLSWQRDPQALWLPVVFALLSSSVFFNGLLVLPVLVGASLLYGLVDKQWSARQLLTWLLLGLALIAIYLAYESPLTVDHLWRHVQATDADKAHEYARSVVDWERKMALDNAGLQWWDYLLRSITTFLVLIGASCWSAQLPGAIYGAAITGSVIIGVLLWFGLRGGWWRNRFWLTMTVWILLGLAMVAIGRGMSLGEQVGLVSRYRYYSFLLLFLALVPAWQYIVARWELIALKQVLFASLLGGFVSVAGLAELRAISEMVVKVQTTYRYLLLDGGLGRSQMPFYPHNLDKRLLNAHQGGYFSLYQALPQRFKPQQLYSVSQGCPALPMREQAISAYSKHARALAVELVLELVPAANGDEVLLCNEAGGKVLVLGDVQREEDGARYLPQVILKSELAPAHYQVYARPIGGTQWRAIGAIEFR